jgi:hypothetical protein
MGLVSLPSLQAEGDEPTPPLQILTMEEFLKLPENIQAVYVGGILEGISFVAYGNAEPQFSAWVKCVRATTLGQTTQDVVSFIKSSSDFDENIASAVAQVLGKRCHKSAS